MLYGIINGDGSDSGSAAATHRVSNEFISEMNLWMMMVIVVASSHTFARPSDVGECGSDNKYIRNGELQYFGQNCGA